MPTFLEEIAEPRAFIDNRCDPQIIDRLAALSETERPTHWQSLERTISDLLQERRRAVEQVFHLKNKHHEPIFQPEREKLKVARFIPEAKEKGLDVVFAEWVIQSIMIDSRNMQHTLMKDGIKEPDVKFVSGETIFQFVKGGQVIDRYKSGVAAPATASTIESFWKLYHQLVAEATAEKAELRVTPKRQTPSRPVGW